MDAGAGVGVPCPGIAVYLGLACCCAFPATFGAVGDVPKIARAANTITTTMAKAMTAPIAVPIT